MARIEILAEVTGKVWKIQILQGVRVRDDDSIMIIESMKMEIPVVSTALGVLVEIMVSEGDAVVEGQVVAIIES